jgi:deoxyribonuclease-4
MKPIILGSHVGLNSPQYLLGAVEEALSYGSTTFMIYTGAPQNSIRKPINQLKVEEGLARLRQAGLDSRHIVVHAPYIINLGNTLKLDTYTMAIQFLVTELSRVQAMGFSTLVLHPGAHVGAGSQAALDRIVEGLDVVLAQDQGQVKIALETMAGKGSEVGITFEEIKYIIDHVKQPNRLGVCLDTCHIHDAGYDVKDVDGILHQFDTIIGLNRLLVVHINDSKNSQGARKDRHENLGYGAIGFDILNSFVHHPKLVHVPKILETPWVGERTPYQDEIAMLRQGAFKKDWRQGYPVSQTEEKE